MTAGRPHLMHSLRRQLIFMETDMRRIVTATILAVGLAAMLHAQAPPPAGAMYKLGTFERDGRTFIGVVVNETLVADLEQANAAMEKSPGSARVAMPRDMKELIANYGAPGLRGRIAAIAAQVGAQTRPAFVHDIKSLRLRPPVAPTTILNAAVNYVEHANEMGLAAAARPGAAAQKPAEAPQSMPGMWQRKEGDTRHNPYFFLKPTSVVIASGDTIRLPPGRDRIDWECELSVVVGRVATRVPLDRADDYIFGYTLQNDVSDRGGRGDTRHGSDWLIGKGHDTFAPLGPFIVPKEFVADPQKMPITFTLTGKVMQDSNTDRMTHNVREMLSFASHILTLQPGDILAMGSPAGVGAARGVFFKDGDTSVCTIGNIGTLTNPVAATAASSPASGR
jgi:2-keto-4-pentenoate hydratase/2-oxohepta-3-ene-1,7-dioic acid hydratase in catechol pathway